MKKVFVLMREKEIVCAFENRNKAILTMIELNNEFGKIYKVKEINLYLSFE